ncbi:transcription antitermination factor NusB [Sodalis-like secondary symbiont of Drepanosiphum platanoidis]|uniref:transcription antitermination factor NusB n=1 Tax=Sodalis-like secondary symbiont of Drepanosiphum platanoidis TaxID=2994493 RepID=UPI003464DC09
MNLSPRHQARKKAVQALYALEVSKNDIYSIENFFLKKKNMKYVDINYFSELYLKVAFNFKFLDKLMIPYLSRPIENIGYIESAILRIALYELCKKKEIPYKVIINEAIKLTKSFGPTESYKFVNAVLDKVCKKIRFK